MVRARLGRHRDKFALGCVLLAAAGLVLWATSSDDHVHQRRAVGPTGPNRPAYPTLLGHALAGVETVDIRGGAGITTSVTRPAFVRRIASWFEQLPHPRPDSVSAEGEDRCSGYRPVAVRFDFRAGAGRLLFSAVDSLPGPMPGMCPGSISSQGLALADDDYVTRVSGLIGVDLTSNPRTLRREEEAKRDAPRLFRFVRVPPGSRLVKTVDPTFDSRMALPFRNSVSASRVWRVRLPLLKAYKWVKAHPPLGSYPGGFSGEVGGQAGVEEDRGDGYSYPPLAGQADHRELDMEVAHYVREGAWTRIEADVTETWIIARPAGEKIPRGVRTLVIRGLGRHVRRITRPDVIRRVVHWFDSRRIVQSYVGECGRGFPDLRDVTITFLDATGKVLASATDPRASDWGGGCNPISFKVRGQKEPELDPGIYDSFEPLLR